MPGVIFGLTTDIEPCPNGYQGLAGRMRDRVLRWPTRHFGGETVRILARFTTRLRSRSSLSVGVAFRLLGPGCCRTGVLG